MTRQRIRPSLKRSVYEDCPCCAGVGLVKTAESMAIEVIPEEKGPKLEIQKMRRRHASRRHTGHRQKYTQVKITGITVPNLEVVSGN
jgi:large subunit ribosomal protein L21